MNEKLVELYKSNWTKLSNELNLIISNKTYSQKPTNPLLLSINENAYLESDIKVLFLGQETNDWGNDFSGNIEETLEIYDDFYNSNYALDSYGGHFWNGINRFIELMNKKFKGKKVSYIWSNVVKIGASGRDQNHPEDYIYNIELENFKVLEKELDILKPDVILFVSGPNYDYNIEKNLEGVKFSSFNSNFSTRQLAKIKYKNFKNIYRTYHPNYLWRNKINEYFNAIINDIELKQ
ncbi:hypothetical protein PW52_16950 [Tamlana sedimentorum]|uniref:Uracil-DNA glycosylase-like domain-containing protein n=1 Tax=Neotamlana sedimentorum TaxID=1435349 RepID=A0A0D7VVT1_9FLAO|nr:uracil-DNA glycosylase family protein [Tamlana sedimentorum]KJD30985.1 hypothetical protein PW52_16950 [Tamlana sedimentorum]